MEYIPSYHPKHTIQLLMALEEHLDKMDDTQLKNYRKLCRKLSIEPKPLQCVKPYKKGKRTYHKSRSKK